MHLNTPFQNDQKTEKPLAADTEVRLIVRNFQIVTAVKEGASRFVNPGFDFRCRVPVPCCRRIRYWVGCLER